jgi:soluble lytic murein transglycosylase
MRSRLDLADDNTREWRVRVALAARDFAKDTHRARRNVVHQQADPRWRYLRARVLTKLDRGDEARCSILDARTRGEFPRLSRRRLAQAALLDLSDRARRRSRRKPKRMRRQPDLARAFEFFALDRSAEARREWDFALPSLTPAQRRVAAEVASELGWYDRAVYTLWPRRRPCACMHCASRSARHDQIIRAARAADIDPSWAYAIIRAESAWTADAHSSADAWGLMQLLPGTASQLAKAIKLRYGGARDLLDPDTNITLGTRYLGNMALHYDGSPWLASAAYNAGVDPVGRWLSARDALEPDFFIETIPYKETREYVSRVLAFSVIYDWRMHGNAVSLSSKLPRIGQAYSPPADDAARKTVVCSPAASQVPQTATTVPTPAAKPDAHE